MAKKKVTKKTVRRPTANQGTQVRKGLAELAAQSAAMPSGGGDAWKGGKEGDTVAGIVQRCAVETGQFGAHHVILIDVGEREPVMVRCGTVLERLVQEYQVRPSDRIAITYKGESESSGKGGRKARLYTMVVTDAKGVRRDPIAIEEPTKPARRGKKE